MKKLLFIIVLLFVKTISIAQYFDGVKIDGSLYSVVQSYKKKGYEIYKNLENCVVLSGKLFGDDIELFIHSTPTTKIAYKAVVYLPKKDSWYRLKTSYETYLTAFKEKYGVPVNSYSFFDSPYYEGDGYEESAVANDKVVYGSFWYDYYNTNIYLGISKYMQVQISYENAKNIIIAEKEHKEKQKRVF
jgi:hypothetical protein